MQDTNIMIHLTCKSQNKSIHTTLTDEIRELLSSSGFKWFQIARGNLDLPIDIFTRIEKVIDPG